MQKEFLVPFTFEEPTEKPKREKPERKDKDKEEESQQEEPEDKEPINIEVNVTGSLKLTNDEKSEKE